MQASSVSGDTIVTTDDNVVLDVHDRHFKLIKVEVHTGTRDALVYPSGLYTVTIDRLELDTWCADGVKVQNTGSPAHHVTINSGWARGHARVGEIHQDGIQTMGGHDLVFRNMAWDFVGGGGGCVFIAQGGSGAETPMRMTFDHCAFGPSHPNCIRFPSGTGHILKDALVYRPFSGRDAISYPAGSVQESGTVLRASGTQAGLEETWAAMLQYVGDNVEPPDPPDPPDPPTPGDCDECWAALESTQAQLAAANAEAQRLTAVLAAAEIKEDEVDALLAQALATDIVPG